ncbi:bifunctional phosphopantothenoylcysteine decarboxylase/phosphopantothenate synthase [Mergibacter septicus]|uniref:bifunctional phosphopantothenoylcysteine decarboxylase/phosphopantothenate--cysteine ligase CoaBC n=1 Tax=Mergibacter septicus TaxID=221402 RepID=UPI0011792A27|nr:bifunctional phosphopantothenoylcysteine decarboxylase/phosphopantothenate--cysteine ligase CoaBC [Mergibacter septicus]AWX14420.1 bifunctional phosphopantothenoylcysteine decarboxylase/phosphopantothenate synthase [Mergibacter septicus]
MAQVVYRKRILIGISGGIAAYKTMELIRLLRKQQAEVRVVLTQAASHFVTPLTLQAISGNLVAESLLDPQAELAMGHIELAKWADLILIAPASADLIARLATGMANDLLTTLCLATTAPIFLAPAMNQQMYRQAIVQQNLANLCQRGITLIGPNSGEQACGDTGIGRMSEPQELFESIAQYFVKSPLSSQQLASINQLPSLNVLITAGPTREPLDPVRYLSNHSSGKMGFALAQAFAAVGAKVTLICGPVNLPTPVNVTRVDVQTALEMWQKSLELAPQNQIFIGCAAVADYRVEQISTQKIKKSGDKIQLNLVKNPDIIADVAHLPNPPFMVGFAAETQDLAIYAQDKLQRKKLDMICANDVSSQTQGFNSDNNALQLFWKNGEYQLPLANKKELAQRLVEIIIQRYQVSQEK